VVRLDYLKHGALRDVQGRPHLDCKGSDIQSPVEPLVDADTWERAQRQLTSNQRFPTRGSNRLYLLRGLMRCADCGTVYTGALASSGRQKKAYYRCSSQLGVRKSIEIRCKGKLIPAELLESLVWEEIRSFVMNPGKVIHKLKKRMDAELKGTPNEEARKRKLQREITQKEGANGRVMTIKWPPSPASRTTTRLSSLSAHPDRRCDWLVLLRSLKSIPAMSHRFR